MHIIVKHQQDNLKLSSVSDIKQEINYKWFKLNSKHPYPYDLIVTG